MKPYKGMENNRGGSSYINKTFLKRDVSKDPNEVGEKEQQAQDLEAARRTHHFQKIPRRSVCLEIWKGEKKNRYPGCLASS